MEECVVEFDRLHALDQGKQPLIPGSRIYFIIRFRRACALPDQAVASSRQRCHDRCRLGFVVLNRNLAVIAANRTEQCVPGGSTPLLQCPAVLCVDCRVSQVKAVLCNGIENCPYDFPLRRVPVRLQRHASLKPPTYLRINPRRKDVAVGIGRERVKSAFTAAEQVDRLCQRQTSSRHRPVF
jgi:hypothetical protein